MANSRNFRISFEFYPPKTEEGIKQLQQTAIQLKPFNPDFFSVTFGAGGSLREGTTQTVMLLQDHSQVPVAPHLACIGINRETVAGLLKRYQQLGIKRIVALRGDVPMQQKLPGEFNFASELIQVIREETANHFNIEVAAYPEFHPEAKNAAQDILNLKRKYEAGANSAITQFFFNADAYFHYVDLCAKQGVNFSIFAGLMPIFHFDKLIKFAATCGAEIPLWIRKRMETYASDPIAIKEFGIEVLTKLCQQLIQGGAPGLHFYTLNKAELSSRILQEIAEYLPRRLTNVRVVEA